MTFPAGFRHILGILARAVGVAGWPLLFSAGLLLAGCQAPEPPLRVAMTHWVGYQPLYLAEALGYYGKTPVRLANFNSNIESLRAFRNGDVEVAALTLDEVLLLHNDAHDARVILVMDYSQGADAIVSHPEYPDMRSLKGRRVGVESTAAGAYMLARALEQSGMTSDSVEIVKIGSGNQLQAFQDGSVDALVTYEPLRTQLMKLGARELFKSTQIPGEILDVIAVRGSVLTERPEAIATLLSAWFRARDYAQLHPAETAERIAPRIGLTPAEFHQAVAGIRHPSIAENCQLLVDPAKQLNATIGRLYAVMARTALLTNPHTPHADILDSTQLQRFDCKNTHMTATGITR